MVQLPDTVAMTQDLEQYMQQTQESMLMTTTEQDVVAEKSEVEEESPSVQQTETVPAAESAQGTQPSITLCSSYIFCKTFASG